MRPLSVRVRNESGYPLPAPATAGAVGLDLRAAIADAVELLPGEWRAIPTGLYLELPAGYEGQVRPRSGLAAQYGVTVLNSPGTIDPDYRGEVQVLLINLGRTGFRIEPGMRIAQLVIAPTVQVRWEVVEQLSPTERGSGGFGHTGV